MARRSGPTPRRAWTPLARGTRVIKPETRAAYRELTGREIDDDERGSEIWLNDRYVVTVDRREDGSVETISIRRQDRGHARDWRDFQRIKNEIAGPEIEAFELYPAESRLVDTANKFWLWVMPPGMTLPVGFSERHVEGAEAAEAFGARQRPFDETLDV